ncbi:uncharacterized protein BP5553_07688 [Venustampulla echinocandica]|uniref:HPP transmembrane region domain-containing protein n=1 Tax=Venustampulla echinocandica TaxID=2656787 RepID=A0A370TH98_9HELO|nr:uncharacterized protein BP5553_07688 [Venustampulla echinocandica]RDL34560.1 hypothetical protein BP5553_07688 [Venustampulla echinocandica]
MRPAASLGAASMSGAAFDFDVDDYINRFVPRSRLYLLPTPVSWLLGYRAKPSPRPPIGSLLVWCWSCLGAFCGLMVVEAVFRTKAIQFHGVPVVIASFGATAILEYHTIDSPLAQPRNVILGQTFAAIIGVSITKLFHLNANFEELRWIAGALAVGISSAFMGLTKTVHPPAGATALLAATTPDITVLGWMLVPLVLLGSTLMVAVACVLNNIQRQFPTYWWTPLDLGTARPNDTIEELEGVRSNGHGDIYCTHDKASLMINDVGIFVPEWLSLGTEERAVLEILRSRLKHQPRPSTSSDTDGGVR